MTKLLTLSFLVLFGATCALSDTYNSTVRKLIHEVLESQVKRDQELRLPWSWRQQKGLFPSFVHFNFVGNPAMRAVRDKLKVFDNNAFTTMWVSQVLVEAASLGAADWVPESAIVDALEAVSTFEEKNFPGQGAVSFWPQEKKGGVWEASPENLMEVFDDVQKGGRHLKRILEAIGQDHLWERLKPLFEGMANTAGAFKIPADFDDSFVNLGLGSMLAINRREFPGAHALWGAKNTKAEIDKLHQSLLKYSYMPNRETVQSVIDPRSYYFLHGFLDETHCDLTVATTWIMDYKQSCASSQYRMPFNVNNVDSSVGANVLFGLASRFVADPKETCWLNEDVMNVWRDTARYVAWVVRGKRLHERPDLALMYYPDIYMQMWFAGRSVKLLNSAKASGVPLPPVVEAVRSTLESALRVEGLGWIASQAKIDDDECHWEQWLGAADRSIFGKLRGPDDGVFTTAAALNTIFDVWSVQSCDGKLSWAPNTPATMKVLAAKGARYLNAHVFKESLENVFFSGSVKGPVQVPFFYPANLVQFVNGSAVPQGYYPDSKVLAAMRGVVPEAQYAKMVAERHFGQPTPTDFTSFNAYAFPFWSAPALTQSVSALALVKADALLRRVAEVQRFSALSFFLRSDFEIQPPNFLKTEGS